MYNCRLISEDLQELWEQIVIHCPHSGFQQTFDWAEYHKQMKWIIFKVGLFENDKLIGGALIYLYQIKPDLAFLYCPDGPVFDLENENLWNEFTKVISGIKLKYPSVAFFRIEPRLHSIPKIIESKFKKSQLNHFPANTVIIDLTLGNQTLLKEMHKKARYNINLSQKKSLEFKIFEAPTKQQMDEFYSLYQQTAEKQKFKTKKIETFNSLSKSLSKNLVLFMVLKDNKLISAGLVIKFENQLIYYFGASDYEYRQLMPNHFLQYNIINWGIENGFSEYDLWGISPKDSTDHTWLGFTKFKLQLGGKVKSYTGAYDLVLDQSKYQEYTKIIQRTQD